MLKFSLKTLLMLMSLVGIATHTLTSPSLTAAVVIAIATGSYLLGITILGFRKRCCFLISLGCLCGCYLGFADGGISWPWKLPTERILNQHSVSQEYFADNQIRSRSLLNWTYLTCVQQCGKANGIASSVEIPTIIPASSLSLGNGRTIELPSMSLTIPSRLCLVNNGKRIAYMERYEPKNKPFFIVGHCWFVLSIVFSSQMLLAKFRWQAPPPA